MCASNVEVCGEGAAADGGNGDGGWRGAAAMRDPDWREFLKNDPEMVEEMNSMIIVPWSHSPMQ